MKQNFEASIFASSKLCTVLGPSVSHSFTMMPRMKKSTSINLTTLAIASSVRFRNG